MDTWRRGARGTTEDVYGLLDDIRARPQYWHVIGSLEQLNLLLVGYRAAVEIHESGEDIDFAFGNPGPFSDWVRLRHPVFTEHGGGISIKEPGSSCYWPSAIERRAAELGVPAFDLFFTLVEEFRVARAACRFGRQASRIPEVPSAVDVPFTRIATHPPTMPWFEQGEAVSRGVYPIVAALDAQPEWHRAWTLEILDDPTAWPVPDVDFESSMVVVVEVGGRPTGGYGVEVERIVEADGVLYVCAVETQPGPRSATTQAVTYPSDSATTPHFDGPVRVVVRSETRHH